MRHFKFDFNNFVCTSDAHGHRPDERHSFETNLDAQIELLHFVASLHDDVRIVPTCTTNVQNLVLLRRSCARPSRDGVLGQLVEKLSTGC